MHIEPGILNAAKLVSANAGAIATLATFGAGLVRQPILLVRAGLAAVFFSMFMEIFHLPVGASELHFVGASAVYMLFGFLPTLVAFAVGLLLQGLVFEPQDLVHLGVNSLSLMLPLIVAHQVVGRRFFAGRNKLAVRWASVVRFDAIYYAGLVTMVGFWLSLGNEPTPVLNWLGFALSYVPLVLVEPLFTWGVVKLAHRNRRRLGAATAVADLVIA
ncbi:MAG: energy-coupling factor ABC transporter permease [Devosia sp.]|nr:energy-coupling factor ABC transporter permease [Devosia sp.]